MKKTNLFTIALSVLILASCSTSLDVVDGGMFQKRKYNKGFHINKSKKIATPKAVENDVELTKVNLEEKSTSKTEIVTNNEVITNNVEQKTNVISVSNEQKETQISKNEVVSSTLENIDNDKPNLSDSKTRNNKLGNSRNIISYAKSTKFEKSETSQIMTDTLLLVIIAIFIPFLAVGLYEGITNRFWISLLLTLLFFLPGMIYAILVVTGNI